MVPNARTPRRRLMVALTVCLCGTLGSTLVAAQETPETLTDTVRDLELRAKPVTVVLAPHSAELREAQRAARGGTAVLALAVRSIEGSSTQPVRINVFVNKPDASRDTSIDDPHFVGYIFIVPLQGNVRGGGRVFALADELNADEPLRITFVPVVGENAAPENTTLRIGSIVVRKEP